jgi:hypothetical protein
MPPRTVQSDFLHDVLSANYAAAGEESLEGEMPSPRKLRLTAKRRCLPKLQMERVAEILPDPPAPRESVHIVSNAQYDFAAWIPHALTWMGRADALYVSTWTLSRPNALDLFAMHDAEQIARGQIHFLTGLYFKRRETAVYAMLLEGIRARGGRYKAFENHAKVLLIACAARRLWITVEGSANLTANPRVEQYVVTNDRALHDFHRGWMEEVFATSAGVAPKKRPAASAARHGFSCRRAGLGVLAATNDAHSRRWILRLKTAPLPDDAALARIVDGIVELIRAALPALPAGVVCSQPPQGASWPRDYFARAIAMAVANALGVPHRDLLSREHPKKRHGIQPSLEQPAFHCDTPHPGPVLVIDDLITTGTTMRLSREAIAARGAPAYGFAYNGS